MFNRWKLSSLAVALVLATPALHGQTVSCTGVSAWSATTTYAVGAQVTYQNGLYKALVSTTNVTPNYCPACGWWQFMGTCGTTPTCTTVAPVPTGLASSNITTTGATVSWSAVSAPANCTVTYNVYRDGTQVATGLSGTSTALSGLTANTTYSITVASVDAAGTSAKSTALSVKTLANPTCTAAPSVPAGLASPSQTTSSVNLTWNASTAGTGCTVSYKVYQGGTQVATPTTNSVTISGLAANTTYAFTVASVDSFGTSAQSTALSVKTPANPTCTAAPSVPTGLATTAVTSSSVNLSWTASTAGSGCSVTYNVYKNGTLVSTVPTTSAVVSGLSASTAYSFTVASVDSAGASTQSSALSVTTPAIPGNVTTTGRVDFHLHLGVSAAQDKLILDGDNYTDLMMSNFIAGVMCGHLIQTYYPGMQFDRDYLYGSIMGQLLQENLATDLYKSTGSVIDPDPNQQAVMGVGQGGPYQINNYAADMVAGTYTPAGYSLINFIAIQKNIGYTMAQAPSQNTKVTPASFNNKYYSPMLTAYFHYLDFVALIVTGKGTGGWVTPWQPAYDNCLANFKNLPNNFLEVILNVAYNQGFYGGLVAEYSTKGVTANASTIATVRNYSSVWGQEWYHQYPYQVMYYLDQMYDKPIPTTSPTALITPQNHIAFNMATLSGVFSNVFQTLAYVNASGQYVNISASQANAAFTSALTQAGVSNTATLDLSNTSDRAQIFNVLEKAVTNLETSLGMKFNATTTTQL